MSLQAISWAMALDIKPAGKKFTLVALANYADGDGVCFPGQAKLADDTSQTDRSVRKHLAELETDGIISRIHRRRGDGSRTSDEYTLNILPEMVSACNEANRKETSEPTGNDFRAYRKRFPGLPEEFSGPTGNDFRASNLLEEPSGNRKKDYPLTPTPESEFEVWYAEYPNKVARVAALKAFRTARKKADLETLREGVRRYIATKPPDRDWCNPATWLNQERWLDQPAAVLPAARASPHQKSFDAAAKALALYQEERR